MYALHGTTDGTSPNTYPKHTSTGMGVINFIGVTNASTSNFYWHPPGVSRQPSQFNITWPDFVCHWDISSGNITMYMEGLTTGWIGVGFNDEVSRF